MFSDSTVAEIEALLDGKASDYGWRSVATEVQDDFEVLLVLIEVDETFVPKEKRGYTFAYDTLDTRIPPKRDGTYGWLVVFKRNGDVIDSLMHGVV